MEKILKYLLTVGVVLGVVASGYLLFLGGVEDPDLIDNRQDNQNTDSSNTSLTDSSATTGEYVNEYNRSPTEINKKRSDKYWFGEVGTEVGLESLDIREYISNNRTRPPPKEGDGSGVYVTDYNNDDFPDLLGVLNKTPVMYENRGGEYKKKDVLPEINVPVTAAHFFDYDNDGWDDLYLLSNEGSVFFENERGEYERKTVGVELAYSSVRGAATADYTGNGCPDLFVVQSQDWRQFQPNGHNDRKVTIEEDNGNENRLFAGNCEEFEETTDEAGINGEAWSLATSFVDFTNDGYPDIHVANDFNNDVLYVNNRNGTFDRRVMPNFTNRNGMSSEVADVNNDGLLDIFVSNIHHRGAPGTVHRYGGRVRGNNLLINKGDGSFVDAADEYGVRRGGWAWAALVEDFNNDGYLDIYQSNSLVWGSRQPNFWKGKETEFTRMNSSSMGFMTSEHLGAAELDYDVDGNLDIATSDITTRAPFYENHLKDGNWLTVRLESDGSNTTLGSKVKITMGERKIERVQSSNSDYFSQGTRTLHFGLGDVENVDELQVNWNSGELDTYRDIEPNQNLKISPDEGMRKLDTDRRR